MPRHALSLLIRRSTVFLFVELSVVADRASPFAPLPLPVGGLVPFLRDDGLDAAPAQVGAVAAGKMSRDELREIEDSACPGAGACGGQFTANTMSMAMEFLGISPAGANDVPAIDPHKDEVAERAGRYVKKTIMELGGSDPFVVLEDADVKLTIDRAVFGKMTNMGQSCVAAKRFILLQSVSDEFVDGFRERLAALKMGDPLDESTGVAPLSSVEAATRLEDQVNRSVAGGARVILGGKRPSPDSAFFEPTILTNVKKGTPAYDEELFGPVAAVMAVPDEETAIAVANDTKYGLGGSVYTRDLERGRRVADQIDAGMVFVNHPAWIYEDMPFGGIKKSGYGRETGPLGIQEFVNKKLLRAPLSA